MTVEEAARMINITDLVLAELRPWSVTRPAILRAAGGGLVTAAALHEAARWLDEADPRAEVQFPCPREAARLRRYAAAMEEVTRDDTSE